MKNYRKFLIGIGYIVACTLLGYWHIQKGPVFDGMGLASIFGGLATGVLAVIWGNTKEHQGAKNE